MIELPIEGFVVLMFALAFLSAVVTGGIVGIWMGLSIRDNPHRR